MPHDVLLCCLLTNLPMSSFRMKQSHPGIFEDLCLYSEICLILAEYSFRLFSRRFVHELFMDVDFKELMAEPCKLLSIKLPVSSLSPAGGEGTIQEATTVSSGGVGITNPLQQQLGNLAEVASDDALSPP